MYINIKLSEFELENLHSSEVANSIISRVRSKAKPYRRKTSDLSEARVSFIGFLADRIEVTGKSEDCLGTLAETYKYYLEWSEDNLCESTLGKLQFKSMLEDNDILPKNSSGNILKLYNSKWKW